MQAMLIKIKSNLVAIFKGATLFLNSKNTRSLADCQLLIVDDQLTSCIVMESMLQDIVSCVSVNSGAAAIEYCKNYSPDLVLMDVYMPDLDGHSTCKILRDIPEKSEIPVIFVTSSTTDDEETKCWDSGCVDFVSKPINACTLRNRVKSHLSHKLKNDLLEQLIYIDKLTGSYNRHFLDDYLPQVIKDGKRNNTPISVILYDVDYFKRYNDRYGHIEGDKCLLKMSSTIADNLLRPMDKLVRVGGEEFLVILPDTDEKGASLVSRRLLNSISMLNIAHEDSEYSHVTLSAGVVTKPSDDTKTIDYLMLQADKNLYTAKNLGRNCVVDANQTVYHAQ